MKYKMNEGTFEIWILKLVNSLVQKAGLKYVVGQENLFLKDKLTCNIPKDWEKLIFLENIRNNPWSESCISFRDRGIMRKNGQNEMEEI